MYIYDVQEDSWTEGESMPTARGALTTQRYNNYIFAIGGMTSFGPTTINEMYDIEKETWMIKEPMPTAREHLASGIIEDKIFVVGGRVQFGANLNNNEMYDIKEDKWEIMEDMVSERGGLAATALKKSVFVFGGESRVKTFNNNEQFNSMDNIWIIREEMPTARHGLVAIAHNFSIFVIGGGTEPGYSMSGLNEVFTPSEFWNTENLEDKVIPELNPRCVSFCSNQVNVTIPELNSSNQVNVIISEPEEEIQEDRISEIGDAFDSCQLVDRCLSPSEQTSSRVIYYIFVIVIIILLIAISFTLISLYRYSKLEKK